MLRPSASALHDQINISQCPTCNCHHFIWCCNIALSQQVQPYALWDSQGMLTHDYCASTCQTKTAQALYNVLGPKWHKLNTQLMPYSAATCNMRLTVIQNAQLVDGNNMTTLLCSVPQSYLWTTTDAMQHWHALSELLQREAYSCCSNWLTLTATLQKNADEDSESLFSLWHFQQKHGIACM